MIKFRLHRGGLQESLATQIEVKNMQDIFEYFNKDNPFPLLSVDDLKCRYYGYDVRLNCDLHAIAYESGVIGFIIGFTDEKIG